MNKNLNSLVNIGIECESIETETWGVGRIVTKLLENISSRPELINEFRFFLFFKSHIPDLPYLNNPIFIKKIIGTPSFSLYYYLLLPIKLWFKKLDMMFFPNYMLPMIFNGKSLVILTEDIYYEMRRRDLPIRYKLAYKIFAGWAARHADKIMAISETSKQELIRLFCIEPERIVVNPLGIDAPKIKNYELRIKNGNSETTNYKPQATNYLLYIGQAFPRRHLRETMLAFESLLAKNILGAPSDIKLIAIGYDRYNPPIIKKLVSDINKRLGCEKIIYKEYASEEELADLYANARLVVYISSKEAFGLPPLEALSYNVPAVVADKPITREIFGNNAFFAADPDDSDSIAEAIAEGLSDNTKRQKIKNARDVILSQYTWQKHTDGFLEIIRTMQ